MRQLGKQAIEGGTLGSNRNHLLMHQPLHQHQSMRCHCQKMSQLHTLSLRTRLESLVSRNELCCSSKGSGVESHKPRAGSQPSVTPVQGIQHLLPDSGSSRHTHGAYTNIQVKTLRYKIKFKKKIKTSNMVHSIRGISSHLYIVAKIFN